MPDTGFKFMRKILGATSEVVEDCKHSIINRETYNIHVIRPRGIDGSLPAIVAIHGSWALGGIDGMHKFYSNMAIDTKVQKRLEV